MKQDESMIQGMAATNLHAAVHVRSSRGEQVALHRHDQHELVLIVRGEIQVAAAGRLLEGRPGQVQVFPAGVVHDQRCRESWHTLCVLVHRAPWTSPQVISTEGDALVGAWMDQLTGLAGSRDEDAVAGDALLTALVARLTGHARRATLDAAVHPALLAAEERIRRTLDRTLDIAALARQVGLSQSHLGALFRARHGCSPLRWHQHLRLERAQTLLANPYASVTAVARELGFADPAYFIRRFRLAHGRAPGLWRRGRRGPG